MSAREVHVPFRAFLYADPAAHSLSPLMHRAAFAHAGLPGIYDAVRVPAEALPDAVAALRHPEVLGANLSLPHKESVLPLLDDLTPAARAIGAVNTVIRQGKRLLGDNTDAPGLLAALQEAGMAGDGAEGRAPVVVLGAGGAARAAVYAALMGLQRDVYIVNRTPAKAEALAAQWQVPGLTVRAAHTTEVPWPDIGLIINSSSAGLNDPAQSPLPGFDWTRTGAAVYDMVYKPAETRLMREARAAGLSAENGLGMLAHQARLAFTAWTGRDVPVAVFLAALGQGT